MKGSKVVAALKGIVETTARSTLSTEDKLAVRTLLDIINLCLFTPTYQVPNIIPTSSYGWIVSDLRDISEDLYRIAIDTSEDITEVEAALAHFHLSKVLQSLILATRLGRRGWPSLSQQMLSLTTSASPTETSTDS